MFCFLQTEYLLKTTYPNSTFSLTCSTHELERVCRDLQTVTLAGNITDSILTYDTNNNDISIGEESDISGWIERNVAHERLPSEVFQVINSTRSTLQD